VVGYDGGVPSKPALRRVVGERLPGERPSQVPEREWHALSRALGDGLPFSAIGRELGVSGPRAAALARRAAYRLRAAGLLVG